MATFAITACGRSGTKWLSQILDRSKSFDVGHEPHGNESARYAHYRFAMAKKHSINYGEVNSRIRCGTLDLPLDYRGVIIRHPLALARSAYNRGKGHSWLAEDLELSIEKLDELISRNDVEMWRFEVLTVNLAYLNKMTGKFGVTATEDDLHTKVNTNKSDEDLPEEMRREVDRRCGWFIERYYGS